MTDSQAPVELKTDRLLLRKFELADVPELTRLIGAREVAATTLRIPHPYCEQDARNFIAHMQNGPAENPFAITLRLSGTLIGGIGLRIEPEHQHGELGYWIGAPHWGKGYATEAARIVLNFGFDRLKLHRIFAHHFRHNEASGKVLRKIGMKHEGCLRGHVRKWGEFIDIEVYAILKSEWETLQ